MSLIRQMVSDLPNGRQIDVKSVDGFQGREKEVIVFSAVRAGRGGALGFVSDARRLNVLLTRARRGVRTRGVRTIGVARGPADWPDTGQWTADTGHRLKCRAPMALTIPRRSSLSRGQLIVVGEPRTLVKSREWANWLQWIESQRAVYNEPRWLMPPRPARRRSRSRSRSASSEGSDASGIDELGRRTRRSRSRDGGRGGDVARPSRAQRREAQRARRAAAQGEAEDSDGARWRRNLREAAEAGGAGLAEYAAYSPEGASLLPNWFCAATADGSTYYHNAATLEVCWQPPLAARRAWLPDGADDGSDVRVEAAKAAARGEAPPSLAPPAPTEGTDTEAAASEERQQQEAASVAAAV